MRNRHALPLIALCATLLLGAVQPAVAATPPPTGQPSDPTPIQPNTQSAANQRIFLPAISSGPAAHVQLLELTQATQNAAQSVPMVANRPTVARVYLQAATVLPGQTVTLTATRNGLALAGSPLRRTGITAKPTPSVLQVADSANFLLPAAWLTGSIALTAKVEAGGATSTRTISFQSVPPLRITVVPIRYIHAPNGKVYPAPTSVNFPASVQRMFPIPNVEVRMRAQITYRGDVTSSAADPTATWSSLVDLMLSLKQSDGAASDVVYVGVLPEAITRDYSLTWAGMGISSRATVNFDLNLGPAHELGHALDRRHAPCGGAGGLDPQYPYAGAIIGVPGFDTSNTATFNPSNTTDLMSYCSEWISDYNYVGMYQNQRAAVAGFVAAEDAPIATGGRFDATQAAEDAVLVRARFTAGGAAELLPLYPLRAPIAPQAPPSADATPLTVAFVDAAGATLAEHTVYAVAAEEEGLRIRLVNTLLPRPVGNVAAMELREGDEVLARRPLLQTAQAADAPLITQNGENLQIALSSTEPQMVRVRQGDHVTTLAIDVSDGALSLPLSGLAGGSGTIEAIAADQLGPFVDASSVSAQQIALPDAEPEVWISAPEAPAGNDDILLAGYASDPEDGMLDVQWSINDVPVARGPFLQVARIAQEPGSMLVVARATDSVGHTVLATTTLQTVTASAPQP